eukprot:161492_1
MANMLWENKALNTPTLQHSDQNGTLEKWYKTCPDIHIDKNNRNILTKSNGGWQAAYGAVQVSSGFHEWTLKIIQKTGAISIGVSSDIQNINKTQNAAFHSESGYANYTYISYGCIMDESCKELKYPFHKTDGLKYNLNDILTVSLDLDNGFVSFGINGENLGMAFKNIKIGNELKYRLAISMYGKNECVELLSYWSAPITPKLPSKNVLNKQLKELEIRFNKINLNNLEERFKRHNPLLKYDSASILKE